MSRLVRLLPSIAGGRRTYSFFSSKPGGGRYFNSAKPPKVIAPSTATPAPSSGANASNASASPSSETPDRPITDDLPSKQQVSPERAVESGSFASTNASTHPLSELAPSPLHPLLKQHELTLHHFFSLHRPYLLMNQPTSALFESTTPKSVTAASTPPSSLGTIDDPPVASQEADADAARQLSRALVMNRVGNSVGWEEALARLGLHDVKEPMPPVPAGICLDSTKRKRRKKMKKHKLKKRRRLQRATRLRLGK